MIFWFDPYVIYFTVGATLLLSLIGLWLTAIMPGIARWSKRFFRSLFILFMLLSFIGFINEITYNYPFPMWLMYFGLILETMLLSLPLLMMTAYLIHCVGRKRAFKQTLSCRVGLVGSFYYLAHNLPVQ